MALNPEAPEFIPVNGSSNLFNSVSARAFGNAMAQANASQTSSILNNVSQGIANDKLTKLGTSALGGAVGSGLDFVGSVLSTGLNYDLGLKQNATRNRALDIQETQLNRQWEAARSLGLYSISQLDNGSSDYFASNGYSSMLSRRKRGQEWSPFN